MDGCLVSSSASEGSALHQESSSPPTHLQPALRTSIRHESAIASAAATIIALTCDDKEVSQAPVAGRALRIFYRPVARCRQRDRRP